MAPFFFERRRQALSLLGMTLPPSGIVPDLRPPKGASLSGISSGVENRSVYCRDTDRALLVQEPDGHLRQFHLHKSVDLLLSPRRFLGSCLEIFSIYIGSKSWERNLNGLGKLLLGSGLRVLLWKAPFWRGTHVSLYKNYCTAFKIVFLQFASFSL